MIEIHNMNFEYFKKEIKKYIFETLNNDKLTYDEKWDILDEFILDNKIIEKWKFIKKDFDNC